MRSQVALIHVGLSINTVPYMTFRRHPLVNNAPQVELQLKPHKGLAEHWHRSEQGEDALFAPVHPSVVGCQPLGTGTVGLSKPRCIGASVHQCIGTLHCVHMYWSSVL